MPDVRDHPLRAELRRDLVADALIELLQAVEVSIGEGRTALTPALAKAMREAKEAVHAAGFEVR